MEGQRMSLTLDDISALMTDNVLLKARLRGTEILARTVDEREDECLRLRHQVSVMVDAVCRVENQLEALLYAVADGTGEGSLERCHSVAVPSFLVPQSTCSCCQSSDSETSSVLSSISDLDLDISPNYWRAKIVDLESENEFLIRHNRSFENQMASLHLSNSKQPRSGATDGESVDTGSWERLERAEKAATTRQALCETLSCKVRALQEHVDRLETERGDRNCTDDYNKELEGTVAHLREELQEQQKTIEELQSMNLSWQEYAKTQANKSTAAEAELKHKATQHSMELLCFKEKLTKVEKALAKEQMRFNVAQQKLKRLQDERKTQDQKHNEQHRDNRQASSSEKPGKSQKQNKQKHDTDNAQHRSEQANIVRKTQSKAQDLTKLPTTTAQIGKIARPTRDLVCNGACEDLVARGGSIMHRQPSLENHQDFWDTPDKAFFSGPVASGATSGPRRECTKCSAVTHGECFPSHEAECQDDSQNSTSSRPVTSDGREVCAVCSSPFATGHVRQQSAVECAQGAEADSRMETRCTHCGVVMSVSEVDGHMQNCRYRTSVTPVVALAGGSGRATAAAAAGGVVVKPGHSTHWVQCERCGAIVPLHDLEEHAVRCSMGMAQ